MVLGVREPVRQRWTYSIDGIQHLAHMTAVACGGRQSYEQGVTLSDSVRDLQHFAAWVAHTYGHSEPVDDQHIRDGADCRITLVLLREDFGRNMRRWMTGYIQQDGAHAETRAITCCIACQTCVPNLRHC